MRPDENGGRKRIEVGGRCPAAAAEPKRAIGVFVAGRYAGVVEALSVAIAQEPDLRCIGFATTIDETIVKITEDLPDALLIGAALLLAPSGLETIRALIAAVDIRVVVYGSDGGPMGWLTESIVAARLVPTDAGLSTIFDMLRGDRRAAPLAEPANISDALQKLRNQVRSQRAMVRSARHRLDSQKDVPRPPVSVSLTKRQKEVFMLMQLGHDVQTISRRLGVSVSTVRGHVKQLLLKTDTHSQLEAVAAGVRLGILKG